jgi:molecular chaperone GrpE (heat shock protein)
MSLKPLINNQSLIIDDHKWGAREEKNWDKSSNDIHIDKKTKYPIDGKLQEVRIKIPINSDKEISVQVKKNKLGNVPRKLKKEINDAFEDKQTRDAFIRELLPILENFSSNLDSVEKAIRVLDRISKHFDLEWSTQTIENHLKGALIELTQVYIDSDNKQYYISLDRNKIKISDVDKWTRQRKNIRRK